MSIRTAAVSLGILALGIPLLADIPDGKGGRTSLQASPRRPVLAPAHACCPVGAPGTTVRPLSVAEVKAAGEVAWMSRHRAPDGEAVACYKRVITRAPAFVSSAELKVVGHLRPRVQVTPTARSECCPLSSCPMRRAATVTARTRSAGSR
jgi:hypothetical protein